METPKLYSIKQTREVLGGISASKVYGLIADGQLDLVKLGRRSFVTDYSIDALIADLPGPNR